MTKKTLRRVWIGVMGSTVILIGVALLLLPGPGWLTIFIGLGILATEFAFARRIMDRSRGTAHRLARNVGIPERWCRALHLTPPAPDAPRS